MSQIRIGQDRIEWISNTVNFLVKGEYTEEELEEIFKRVRIKRIFDN